MTLEEKKEEAIKRMKLLNLHEECIAAFKTKNEIWRSEHLGALYECSHYKYLDKVKEIEKQYNILAYHLVFTPTAIGNMLTIFYVSDYEEEWEMDIEDLKCGYSCCYVINLDDDDCSEFGSIMFKKSFGGLVRTA